MIIEYREIKPSKIPPIWSARPTPLTKPKLVTKPKPKDKNEDYVESWKL